MVADSLNTKDISPAVLRAHHLAELGSKTEGIHSSLVCFAAAWILRNEGCEASVCSQVFYFTGNSVNAQESISHQVYLKVDDYLVDELGVYQSEDHLAADRVARFQLRSARTDGFAHVYEQGEEESREIYAVWGVSPEESSAMLALLGAEDGAGILAQATPHATRRGSATRI